eukprot:COSAG02_NODE_2547_length_8563_cov_9.105388_1_plen_34_part_10
MRPGAGAFWRAKSVKLEAGLVAEHRPVGRLAFCP